jgi:hypothetical protein
MKFLPENVHEYLSIGTLDRTETKLFLGKFFSALMQTDSLES